jgi:hypothetical protein
MTFARCPLAPGEGFCYLCREPFDASLRTIEEAARSCLIMFCRVGAESETSFEAGLILVVAIGIPVYETASRLGPRVEES